MPQIDVSLPDGSTLSVDEGSTVADAAMAIGPGLARAAVAARADGESADLSRVLRGGERLEILTSRDEEALDILRHSAAHVMAEAVKQLFPEANFGIGPTVEDGFYYDFDVEEPFTDADLASIEERMRQIVAEELPFDRKEIDRLEAWDLFEGEPYKRELLADLPDDEIVSVYTQGTFTDLCRGPHVPHTGWIESFKLMKVAGAYWRGESSNKMLQRIYGTAWFDKKDLAAYLERLEEAEKRDHRKLGRDLDLFHFDELAGSGLVLYHPKGARVLQMLIDWLRADLYERGYVEIRTPHIYKADVWKTSGHWDYYMEHMYPFEIEDEAEYAVKPMNCPGALLVYANGVRSYRDLPMRLFEFGTVYRHEKSGVVHGLMRARGFTQDDAHIFCTAEQIVPEVKAMLDLVKYIMETFDFEYTAEVSTKPEESVGRDEDWETAQDALMRALDEWGLPYEINEGDGAFYGPKVDIKVRDAIGRVWQLSTIQVDFNLPERFDISYRTAQNTEERPFMLHRAIFGSLERFFGILLEHTAGALPTWLAPVQVVLVPIADRHVEYARGVADELASVGIRCEIDDASEPMKAKIARGQMQKVPYMLVVGDREADSGCVAARDRVQGDLGAMGVTDLAELVLAQRP
jgi:threonyl-tRNA synthetase